MLRNKTHILYSVCLLLLNTHLQSADPRKKALLEAIAHNNQNATIQLLQKGVTTVHAWRRAAKTGNPVFFDLLHKHNCRKPKKNTKLLKRLIKTSNPTSLKKAFDLGLYTKEDLLEIPYTRYKDEKLLRPTKNIIALLDQQKNKKIKSKNICSFCCDNLPKKPGESIPVECPKKHRLCTDCFDCYTQKHYKKNTGQPLTCLTCTVKI